MASSNLDRNSWIDKQYHKEGRALRTETTINNTYDFNVGKRIHNLPSLRQIGFQANWRLLEVEKISYDCMLAEEAFQQMNRPRQVNQQRASALRFADPKVQSLCHALLAFPHLPGGFSNRLLRERSAASSINSTRRSLHGLNKPIFQQHKT